MNGLKNFVKHPNMQLTIRELQNTAKSGNFWIGLTCVVAVLAISGPFDTQDDLNLPQRVAYWGGIAISTYFFAILFMVPATVLSEDKNWHWLKGALIAGIMAGIPIGALVYFVNTHVVSFDVGGLRDFIRLQIVCIIIAIAVSCLRYLIVGRADSAGAADPTAPRLMKRLSPENRGDVLSLNSQDHYVEVVTTRGKELILVRLGDAIEELPGVDGQRIHRSWWVSRSAVANLAPHRDRLYLDLKDGRTVPVSRSNEKMVMDWMR